MRGIGGMPLEEIGWPWPLWSASSGISSAQKNLHISILTALPTLDFSSS